jgi:acyl-CoA synthetase (AMP-forming)/AMP-acid ligase II
VIAETIFDWARRTPERTAVEYNDLAWSYAEFAEAIARVRGEFRRRGVEGGGIAAVAVTNVRDNWVAILALRSLGVTVAPIDAVEVIASLDVSGLRWVVASSAEHWSGLDEACAELGLELILAAPTVDGPADFAAPVHRPGGHILLTSGTTGAFKKVLMDVAFEGDYLRRRQVAVPVTQDTVANLFDFGAWTGLGYRAPMGVWLEGGAMAFTQGRPWHLALRRPGLASSPLLPVMLSEILAQPDGAFPRSETMELRVGGGTVTWAQVEAAKARITPRVINGLSCTESHQIAMTPLNTPEDHRWHILEPTTIVELVDELDRPVATGEIGRLRVGSEGGPTAYLNDEETTKAFFRNGFFYTGDLAVMRADGRIALQGRVTEVINIKGQKISPRPIEDRLRERLGVADVCLISMQDERGEEELHVVIEAATPIDTSVLTTVLRAELYGFPGVNVRYMPLLPRNDAGKVLRQAVTATLFAARRPS